MSSSPGRRERLFLVASEHLYRALLVAYPKGFRQEFEEEMVRAFGDLCREELFLRGGGGVGGLLLVWLRTLLDLSTNAFAERSGSAVSSPSFLVRWGGIAAVAGGLLSVAHGIELYNTPMGMRTYALILIGSSGTLLVFGGLFGLARLVYGRGTLGLSGSGGLGWARRSGTLGLVLAGLAAASALALAVWDSVFGGIVIRGEIDLNAFYIEKAFYGGLGLLLTFGLPLAAVLLGVAAWRFGVLPGRWRFLPLVVGVLASPLVPLTIRAVVNLALYPHVFQFIPWARFVVVGGPGLVTGAGWVLLGLLLLFAGRRGEETQQPVVPAS